MSYYRVRIDRTVSADNPYEAVLTLYGLLEALLPRSGASEYERSRLLSEAPGLSVEETDKEGRALIRSGFVKYGHRT